MIISQRDHLEKMEMGKPLEGLISSLAECPLADLPAKLKENMTWNRPRGDLYHWIPLLNRFDAILESHIEAYKLNEKYVVPHVLKSDDEQLLISVLDFSAMLLDSCSNRVIYSSTHRLYDMINTYSVPVRLSVLKVCVMVGERHCQTNSNRYYAPQDVKDKLFELAKILPPAGHSSSFTYTPLDLCANKPVPPKWKLLDFQYYKTLAVNSNAHAQSATTASPKKNKTHAKSNKRPNFNRESSESPQKMHKSSLLSQRSESFQRVEGIQHLIISEENLRKLSLEQIFDKAIGQIPKESYFSFGLSCAVAKAFNGKSFDHIKLKQQLLSLKLLSIAFLALMIPTSIVNSQIFEHDQHFFSNLAELVDPENTVVPEDIHFHAIKTFENISMRRIWGSEIIKTLGGNISHGLMYQKIRRFLKDMKDGKDFNEKAVIHFFNMLANIIDTKGVSHILINTGILPLLMEFIPTRTNRRWICSGAIHLINLIIQQQNDTIEEFISNDGFRLLREALAYEIDFALENPDFGGGPPKHSIVFYGVTFRQNNFIRTLLKFVLYLVQSDAGDRMRNLYDSPILETFTKILKNPVFLGPEAVSNTLSIITAIIHSEPTAFAILNEATVIDIVLNNFVTFFNRSEELLLALPDVIGAICLNKSGLQKVLESNVISKYLDMFKDVSYAKILVKEDNSSNLGATFDELARHYPDLKEPIIENIVRLVKEMPAIVEDKFTRPQFFQSAQGSLYGSNQDEIVDMEEGSECLPNWETSDGSFLIDNLAVFLSELVQTNQRWSVLIERTSIEDWIRLINIKNAPYDYALSNGLFGVAGLLKFFDDENREYGMRPLLLAIDELLVELGDFIYYDSDEASFFKQFDGVQNGAQLGGKYISLINQVNFLLFVLTDVYVTPTNTFSIRMAQICKFFNGEGEGTLEQLVLLLRRVTLEEINLQLCTPADTIRDTTFFQAIDFSPVQIVLGPSNDTKNKKFDKTSSKFKNTLQLRFHINRIQTWLGYIFATLTRMGVQKRHDTAAHTAKFSIRLAEMFTNHYLSLFEKIETSNALRKSAYHLIILNFMNSLLVTKSRPHEQVVTTFAIIIMQQGGFLTIKEKVKPSIEAIKTFDAKKVEEVKVLKYVDFSLECISINMVKQYLTTVSKIVNKSSLMPIPTIIELYDEDGGGYSYEAIVSFVVQAKIYALGVLDDLFDDPQGIFSHPQSTKNFTLQIVELIIYISKSVFSTAGEDHVKFHSGKLYPLDWRMAVPSTFKHNYLKDVIGLTEDETSEVLAACEGNMELIHFGSLAVDSVIDWEQCSAKAQANPYKRPNMGAVKSQFANITTLPELSTARLDRQKPLIMTCFKILEFFPDSVFRISDLLLDLFGKKSTTFTVCPNVTLPLYERIQASAESDERLVPLSHLYGLLMQEEFVFEGNANMVGGLLSFIKPANASYDWFPHMLLIWEKCLADYVLPEVEELDPPPSTFLPKSLKINHESPERYATIFENLIEIGEFTKVDSALAVCRLLILYAKDPSYCKRITESAVLHSLIVAAKLAAKTPKSFTYQSSLIILVRRCVETEKVVKEIMAYELENLLNGKKAFKHKSLGSILRDTASLVLRSEDAYVDTIAPMILLEEPRKPLRPLNVRYINPEKNSYFKSDEGDVEMADSTTTQQADLSSGIIHFLLTEIMATSRLNYYSSPPEELEEERKYKEEKEKDSKIREPFKYNPLLNENCAYLGFLLQTLAELLCSYKQSKLEFLTFSKKPCPEEVPLKPRPTALNVLIHKLIATNKLVKPEGAEFERRCFISTLARAAIFGLISTPLTKDNRNPDGKKVDPDMNFIRAFTGDIMLKILKDTRKSEVHFNECYSKIFDLIELIGSLISKNRNQFGNIVDKEFVKYDSYLMSKTFLEKGLTHELTEILSNLDLNYPYASKISVSCLKALNSLGHAKKDYQQLFKEGAADGDEEEMETDDMDAREDTPDLFKNSTLGMYDVGDLGSYDYDDEYDDFEGEEGVDIVYSDSDIGSENIDSDASEEEMDEDIDDYSEHMHDEDIASIISDSESEDSEDDGDDDDDNEDDDDDDEDIEIYHDPNIQIQIHGEIDADDDESGTGQDYYDYDDDEEDMFLSDGSGLSFGSGEEDEEINTSDEDLLDEWAANYEAEGDNGDEIVSFDDDGDHGVLFDRDGNSRTPPTVMSHDDDSDQDLEADREENTSEESSINISVLANGRTEFHVHSSARRPRDTIEQSLVNPLLQNIPLTTARNQIGRHGNADLTSQFPDFVDVMSTASNLFDGRFPVRDDAISPLTQLFRMLGGQDLRPRGDDDLRNLNIKSTQQRWAEFTSMFYRNSTHRESCRIIARVVNAIYPSSVRCEDEAKKEEERAKKEEDERLKAEEEARQKQKQEEAAVESDEELDPVYVTIGDRQVNIAGTDIDPEFFEALPDDMREEVFTQHVRERRATATSQSATSREIDPEFLNALPDELRQEILSQELFASHYSNLESNARDAGTEEPSDVATESEGDEKPEKSSTKQRLFFSPLVDKAGVASLLRLLFAEKSYHHRETLHKTLEYLCYNKQTRSEVMSLLLSLLQEGINDHRSLEKAFVQLSARAKALIHPSKGKPALSTEEIKESTLPEFPNNTTALNVAFQAIECISYLLESDPHMRYYFLIEHENLSTFKKFNRQKKLNEPMAKSLKYPINALLSLLNQRLVKDEAALMEVLSRSLQVATRPLNTLKNEKPALSATASPHGNDSDSSMKVEEAAEARNDVSKKSKSGIVPPYVPDSNLERIINILLAEECSGKTFRQALSAMQNLSVLPNAQKVFPVSLSEKATNLGQSLVGDLNGFVQVISTVESLENVEARLLSKFTAPSSDQAKLLRVLTALDYLFDSRENGERKTAEVQQLTKLYRSLALGPLWGALSDALRVLQAKSYLSHISTVLLPLIEALMVVCKHSKVKELPVKEALKYEGKKPDFTNEPIESLFFTFTNEHKKILNLMVRTNPKLMSGPFSMLVRNPFVLEFDNKKNYFDRKLHAEQSAKSTLTVNIRRDQVFLDSFRSLFYKPTEEFKNAKLDIKFRGEDGVDAGGVTREWYQVLSRQMFNADYALFTPVASDKTTFHPNRTSWVNPEHLSFFKFIGRTIGKAVFDNNYLDCHFSRAVYKNILGFSVNLKDMETLDLDYYKSLMWMLENDITDIIVENFAVETDDYGEHKIIDLIPDGRNIAVTEDNKQEYVHRIVEYRLQTSIAEQMDNFLLGFHEIIPKDLISIFSEQELELLISGLPDIDVDDWKNYTTYNNYSASSPQIQWFWRAVRSFDVEERAKLLQFATGTSKVPLHGFKELAGVNGVSKFSIHRDYGPVERLPSSHTCFNQIDLPEYESYETLRSALLLAINEGREGFGLA